jgi:tetratricopeptide (TPR) repeat protein
MILSINRAIRITIVLIIPLFACQFNTGCDTQHGKTLKEVAVENGTTAESEIIIGDTLFKKALYDSAYIYYKRAADYAEKAGNKRDLAEILIKIADIHRMQGNADEAMIVIDKAIALTDVNNKEDQGLLGDILRKKGLLLNNKGYFDSAIVILNSSIKYKTNALGDNDTTLSLNYNLLGISYFYKGDYDNAL